MLQAAGTRDGQDTLKRVSANNNARRCHTCAPNGIGSRATAPVLMSTSTGAWPRISIRSCLLWRYVCGECQCLYYAGFMHELLWIEKVTPISTDAYITPQHLLLGLMCTEWAGAWTSNEWMRFPETTDHT